jgi:hypothetical protein
MARVVESLSRHNFRIAGNPPAIVSNASNNCPLFKHRVICGRSMEIFHQQEFSG